MELYVRALGAPHNHSGVLASIHQGVASHTELYSYERDSQSVSDAQGGDSLS